MEWIGVERQAGGSVPTSSLKIWFVVRIESELGAGEEADNICWYCRGVGCKICQKVTVCGPELSSKVGIKKCDGQKIGWELKRPRALSKHHGTADRQPCRALLPGSQGRGSVWKTTAEGSDWQTPRLSLSFFAWVCGCQHFFPELFPWHLAEAADAKIITQPNLKDTTEGKNFFPQMETKWVFLPDTEFKALFLFYFNSCPMFTQHKDGSGNVAGLWRRDKQREKQSLQSRPIIQQNEPPKKSVIIPEKLPHDGKYAGSQLNLKSVNGDGWRNIFHPRVLA